MIVTKKLTHVSYVVFKIIIYNHVYLLSLSFYAIKAKIYKTTDRLELYPEGKSCDRIIMQKATLYVHHTVFIFNRNSKSQKCHFSIENVDF